MTALSWTHSKEGKGIKESSPTDRHQALWGGTEIPCRLQDNIPSFPPSPAHPLTKSEAAGLLGKAPLRPRPPRAYGAAPVFQIANLELGGSLPREGK